MRARDESRTRRREDPSPPRPPQPAPTGSGRGGLTQCGDTACPVGPGSKWRRRASSTTSRPRRRGPTPSSCACGGRTPLRGARPAGADGPRSGEPRTGSTADPGTGGGASARARRRRAAAKRSRGPRSCAAQTCCRGDPGLCLRRMGAGAFFAGSRVALLGPGRSGSTRSRSRQDRGPPGRG